MALEKMHTLSQAIGELLKQARLLNGLSREDLALLANLNADQVSRYESADEDIKAVELFVIADHLGIPIENFFTSLATETITEERLEAEAYNFMKIFSSIEDPLLRKKILDMCLLANNLKDKPLFQF